METATTALDGPAYRALLAKSEELAMPQAFATDLTTHDRRTLTELKGSFAWYLYPNGTHMVRAHERPHEYDAPRFARQVDQTFAGGRWFWWDAQRGCLVELDLPAICERLKMDWHRRNRRR